jgi:hypothetical protein
MFFRVITHSLPTAPASALVFPTPGRPDGTDLERNGQSNSAPPHMLDIDLFGNRQSIIYFNAQVTHRAFNLPVA